MGVEREEVKEEGHYLQWVYDRAVTFIFTVTPRKAICD